MDFPLDQIELRYQAMQCHARAQRAGFPGDAEWLLDLSAKLARMADVHDQRAIYLACEEIMTPVA